MVATKIHTDEIASLLDRLVKNYRKEVISMIYCDVDETAFLRGEIAEARQMLDQPASWHTTASLMDAQRMEAFDIDRQRLLRLLLVGE